MAVDLKGPEGHRNIRREESSGRAKSVKPRHKKRKRKEIFRDISIIYNIKQFFDFLNNTPGISEHYLRIIFVKIHCLHVL